MLPVCNPVKSTFYVLLLAFVTFFYVMFTLSSAYKSEITKRAAIDLKHQGENSSNSKQPTLVKEEEQDKSHKPGGLTKDKENPVGNSEKNEKPPENVEKPKLKPKPLSQIFCYRIRNEPTLPDILDADPPRGKSIFFHETSCKSYEHNNTILIGSRQACAVESAALLNPSFQIYLTYLSSGIIKDENTTSSRLLKTLQTYKNVHIVHADYERYTKDTPTENLYRERKVESSSFAVSHASDIFRFIALWKYGGIYLDLDTIVLKSMENLTQNFAGLESSTSLGSGILSFDATQKGRSLVHQILEHLRDNYQANDWGYNGPGMITRLAQKVCNTTKPPEMLTKYCNGFEVYPTNAFAPLPWKEWRKFFDEKAIEEVRNKTRESYVIHFWNNVSKKQKIDVKIDVPYSIFAKRCCPKVFALSSLSDGCF